MDDFIPKKLTPAEQLWHAEQARRSLDIIRVYNPTDEDFVIEWGRPVNRYVVKAKQTRDLSRYLARYFREHITTKIINDRAQIKHDADMAQRASKGAQPFESIYQENQATWERPDYPKPHDMKVRALIYDQVELGLVSLNGLDEPLEAPESEVSKYDEETTAILKNIENRRVSDSNYAASPFVEPPIIEEKPKLSKKDVLAEVTDEVAG